MYTLAEKYGLNALVIDKKGGPGSGNYDGPGKPRFARNVNAEYPVDLTSSLYTHMYGGMPEGGGYHSNTEYEIGHQRYAEAAHCILGSLGKAVSSKYQATYAEEEHIREELGIMKKSIEEYSRNVYNDQLEQKQGDKEREHYVEETVRSLVTNSSSLSSKVDQFQSKLGDVRPDLKKIANLSYDSLSVLAKNAPKIKGDLGYNIFREKDLKEVTQKLSDSIDSVFGVTKKPKEKIQIPKRILFPKEDFGDTANVDRMIEMLFGKKESISTITKAKPKTTKKPLSKEQQEFVFRETTSKFEKQFQKKMIAYFKDQEKAALSTIAKNKSFNPSNFSQDQLYSETLGLAGVFHFEPNLEGKSYFPLDSIEEQLLSPSLGLTRVFPRRKKVVQKSANETQEMKDHFEKRTNLHINLVKKYLQKLIDLKDERLDSKILEEEKIHDQSKFEEPEYIPYLHVNWHYHLKDKGEEYNPSEEIKGKMNDATFHHVKNNKHHPEYWDANSTEDSINRNDRDKAPEKQVDATKMPLDYVASMVADWLAMSDEKKTDPFDWAKKNINKRWKFTKDQVQLIDGLLEVVKVNKKEIGLSAIFKGGPGSGSWEGPEQPRFAREGISLSKEERRVLLEYVDSFEFSRMMQEKDAGISDEISDSKYTTFMEAVDKLPDYEGIIYRGDKLSKENLSKLNIGDTWKAGGIYSFTKDKRVARVYAGGHSDDKSDPVVYKMVVHTGAKDLSVVGQAAKEENSVLTKKDVYFEITSISRQGGMVFIEGEQKKIKKSFISITKASPNAAGLSTIFKGGPGSGSWNGPDDPRFAREADKNEVVFHGTYAEAAEKINLEGLRPREFGKVFASGEFYTAANYATTGGELSKDTEGVIVFVDKKAFKEPSAGHFDFTNTEDIDRKYIKEINVYKIEDLRKYLNDVNSVWSYEGKLSIIRPTPIRKFTNKKMLEENYIFCSFIIVNASLKSITKASPNAWPDRFDFSGWAYKDSEWNRRLQAEGGLFIKEVYEAEGKRVWEQLALQLQDGLEGAFDIDNPLIAEFIESYGYKFAQGINETTVSMLQGAMTAGMDEGLGMDGIAKLVREVFDNCTKYRSMLIARTETIRASNGAAKMAYEQSGVVEEMEWLVTRDDRLCPACLSMSGKVVGLDENYFELGDKLTVGSGKDKYTIVFDYEAVEHPPLHPNCRCAVIPRVYDEFLIPKSIGLSTIFKGGPGSGSWDGPGNPRFAHEGKEDSFGRGVLNLTPEQIAVNKSTIDQMNKDIFTPPDVMGISQFNKKQVQKVISNQLEHKDEFSIENVPGIDAFGMRGMQRSSVEEYVRQNIDEWAGTSGDTNPGAVATQLIAQRVFKLGDTAVDHYGETALSGSQKLLDDPKFVERKAAFLQAQYDATQKYFKDNNIKEIILYRGVEHNDAGKLREETIQMQPISSFSVNALEARTFAKISGDYIVGDDNIHKPPSNAGTIYASIVPVEKILSHPRTGFGCTKEGEVTVLGGKMKGTIIPTQIAFDVDRTVWANPFPGNTVYTDYNRRFLEALGKVQPAFREKAVTKKAIYNIDANLNDADWTKKSWDLPEYGSEEFNKFLESSGMTLSQFKKLPVYKWAVERGEIKNKDIGLGLVFKEGNADSGNHGHSGRPGKVGGSGGAGFADAISKGEFNFDKLSNSETKEHQWIKEQILDVAKECKVNLTQSQGYCAEVSVALWDKLKNPKDLMPYSVMNGEEEHVVLLHKKSGMVIDPTGSQFGQRVFALKENTPYQSWKKLSPQEIQGARDELKNRLQPNKGHIEKQTYAPNSILQKERDKLINEIENEEQGPLRKGSARNVIHQDSKEYYNVSLVKEDGKLKGAMSWAQSGPNLVVSNFGTKEPGYGRDMMQDLVNKAAELKCGIRLIAIEDAVGFYEKIGMKKGSFERQFFLTQEDCETRKKALPLIALKDEPQNGVFVYSDHGQKMGLDLFFKHLPGQHDQSTHAGHMVSGTRENLPDHIKKLVIPPAWTDLMYNEEPEADLLVTGKDKKGREQYIYSERFTAQQAAEKFERIKELTEKYGSIHSQNEANAKSNDPKIKEKAECLDLIMETGIRPGGEADTGAEKQAYGATTLLGKHVKIANDGSVSLQFVGKKGVDLDIPVKDSHLKTVLVKRAKSAGEDGKLFDVDDNELRDYTHTLDGGNFKPKDFRTRLATETAVDEVKKFGKTMPTNMKEYKKMVKVVATVVSKKLGNTPVVALQSYIMPAVFAKWRAGFELIPEPKKE